MSKIAGLCVAAIIVTGCASTTQAREPRGRWAFEDDARPVKAVVLGGSVSAYRGGSYSRFLEAACRRVEVKNIAKSRLGAAALYDRFQAQAVRNPKLDPSAHEAVWLIYLGGLNSIGRPDVTNRWHSKLFASARARGLSTMSLGLGPWGAQEDKRWRGFKGLRYWDRTRLVVDHALGRLTPAQAFGRRLGDHDPDQWEAGELPDLAVDLFDSALRDARAALTDVDRLAKHARWDFDAKALLKGLSAEERPAAIDALVARAAQLPRWFMKRELQGFDAIHPNWMGHREIAQVACPRLPDAWGCDCAALPTMRWDRRKRAVVVDSPRAARAPRD